MMSHNRKQKIGKIIHIKVPHAKLLTRVNTCCIPFINVDILYSLDKNGQETL